VVLAPVLFIFFTFKNSVDCSQLVIDTYEIHSGINIPEVNSINCQYDAGQNLRISVYDLEQSMDLSKMKLLKGETISSFLNGTALLSEAERPGNGNYYWANGEKWGRNWVYLVNIDQNRLWVQIKY